MNAWTEPISAGVTVCFTRIGWGGERKQVPGLEWLREPRDQIRNNSRTTTIVAPKGSAVMFLSRFPSHHLTEPKSTLLLCVCQDVLAGLWPNGSKWGFCLRREVVWQITEADPNELFCSLLCYGCFHTSSTRLVITFHLQSIPKTKV